MIEIKFLEWSLNFSDLVWVFYYFVFVHSQHLMVIGITCTKTDETQSAKNPAFDSTGRQAVAVCGKVMEEECKKPQKHRKETDRPDRGSWRSFSSIESHTQHAERFICSWPSESCFFLTSFPFGPSRTAETRKAGQDSLPSWSARTVTEPQETPPVLRALLPCFCQLRGWGLLVYFECSFWLQWIRIFNI